MERKKLRGILLLLFLQILATNLFAEYNNIKFEHLLKNHGLPHSYVNAIIQDQYGFMWFGTVAGLARYDGYSFSVFEYSLSDTNSLNSNNVTSLFEDRDGNIWIGTNGGGLNVYDPVYEKFWHYRNNPSDSNSISNNKILSLLVDSKGHLWIGTDGGGLNKYNIKDDKFTRFYSEDENPNKAASRIIHSIYEDKFGTIWLGTVNGLFQYDPKSENFEQHLVDSTNYNSFDNSVTSVAEDLWGKLWVGTEGKNVHQFHRGKKAFSRLKIKLDKDVDRIEDGVISLLADKDGILWIGTWEGLIQFDQTKDKFNFYYHEEADPFSLNDAGIVSMFQDRSGVIWIGTADGGVNKYDSRKGLFHHIYPVPSLDGRLSTKLINSIYAQRSGILWVGTGNGLNRLEPGANKYQVYLPIEGDETSISHWTVKVIFEDKKGVLWVAASGGLLSGGLNRWDRESKKFKRYMPKPSDPQSLSYGDINTIIDDDIGNIWLGMADGGINILNPKTGIFKRFFHDPYDPKSLSSNRINTIYKDLNGDIWIGTTDAGINKYDVKTNSFIHYSFNEDNISSLKGNAVYSIYDDRSGVLWIGTDLGLNEFKIETGAFRLISKKDGLSGTIIYGIQADNSGNFWLSTNNGLSKYNRQSTTIRNYDVSDGLQGNEFRLGTFHKSSTGEMFIGGNDGYNRFFPEQIVENNFTPNVVITNFKVSNHSKKFERAFFDLKEIELSYKENFFSFEFAALDYFAPEKNQFAYKLEGVDEDWIYLKNQRNASYTDISPGSYVFKVKGSNNHGIWNEEATSVKIIITSPFWSTWWFRILVLSLLIYLVYSFFRWRTKSITEQNIKLEKAVKDKTSEMELIMDKMLRQGKLATIGKISGSIAHEIRNPLGAIKQSAYYLKLKMTGQSEKIAEHLNFIDDEVEVAENVINNLLEMTRIRKPKKETVDIRDVIELSLSRCHLGDSFKTIFALDDEANSVIADHHQLIQVFVNVITNAKHAMDSGGTLTFKTTLSMNKKMSKISITDTGKGIEPDFVNKVFEPLFTTKATGTGFGLNLCRQIVEDSDGSIFISSEVGIGTTIVINLPLRNE